MLSSSSTTSLSGNLRDWTAAEFGRFYQAFYRKLLAYSRTQCSDQLVAEEILQEALLYLLTALPEVDSELGAYRYTKWKIRMLAIDVGRATSNQRSVSFDELDDSILGSEDPKLSKVESLDDAAIVARALATLPERQREALVRNVVRGETISEISREMNLSDGALRQLLQRARANLRMALVGDSTENQDSDTILSIAYRKARREAAKGAKGLALIGLLIMSMAFAWPVADTGIEIAGTANSGTIEGDKRNLQIAEEPSVKPSVRANEGIQARPLDQSSSDEGALQPPPGQTSETSAITGETPFQLTGNAPSRNDETIFLIETFVVPDTEIEISTSYEQNPASESLACNFQTDQISICAKIVGLNGEVESVYLSVLGLNSDIILVPQKWISRSQEFADGSMRVEILASGLVAGNLGGDYPSFAATSASLESMYFQGWVTLDTKMEVIDSNVVFFPRRSS